MVGSESEKRRGPLLWGMLSTREAMTREVIGTCVAMRVKIDGHWPKDALKIIENGEWDDRFN